MKTWLGIVAALMAMGMLTAFPAEKRAKAPELVFSPPGGTCAKALSVKLAIPEGSTVRYTIDGRDPSSNSPVYLSPISVTNSTRIRARVFRPGQPAGEIVGASYTMVGRGLLKFSSNLPLLIINNYSGPLEKGAKFPAYLTSINTNDGRASLLGPVETQQRIGIEWRGSSSMRFPKKGYGMAIIDETTGADIKVPLLGMPADSDWVLYAPYADKTLIRDVITDELWEEMGHYAVRRRLIELFFDRNGGVLSSNDYAGVYVLFEKIKHGKSRVNVDKLELSDTNEPAISGGYILKKDRIDYNDNAISTPIGNLGIEYPKTKNLASAQRTWLEHWFSEFENALQGTNFADPLKGYANYIDVPSFIDYFWITEMPKCIDGYSYSVFMHKQRQGKLFLSPIWDRNLAFGNANYQDGDHYGGWYWKLHWGDDLWYRRLFDDPEFKQQHIDRWGELRQGIFATSNLFARIDGYAEFLDEAQARDFARWPRLGVYAWPNSSSDWPNRTYAGSIGFMKTFASNRLDWIERQFTPMPVFSQHPGVVEPGSQLSILNGTNTTYYTLDGSDPRQRGGTLNPKAQQYIKPIPLTDKTHIFARARQSNNWSPPAEGIYVVNSP